MTKITLIDRDEKTHQLLLQSQCDINLMEHLRDEGFDIDGTCGGAASCGSCHVYLEAGELSDDVGTDEQYTLEGMVHGQSNSRLACQIECASLADINLRLAPSEI